MISLIAMVKPADIKLINVISPDSFSPQRRKTNMKDITVNMIRIFLFLKNFFLSFTGRLAYIFLMMALIIPKNRNTSIVNIVNFIYSLSIPVILLI